MPNAKNLFTIQEKELIKKAILNAELDSSGEIRVHIEDYCKEDVLDHAAYLFKKMEMFKTEQRNGVLFYVAIKDHKFAVLGDAGINAVVEEGFWDEVKTILAAYFIRGEFAEGLAQGITKAGKKLKKHFPYHRDDINELSDEISYC
jgi:uncharacterized membrane protein